MVSYLVIDFMAGDTCRGLLASNNDLCVTGGFKKAYQARGNPGYSGLDKIFVSSHWTWSNGADQGTGSSDHPAIAVDLRLWM